MSDPAFRNSIAGAPLLLWQYQSLVEFTKGVPTLGPEHFGKNVVLEMSSHHYGESICEAGRYTFTWMGAGTLPTHPRQLRLDDAINSDRHWRIFGSGHPGVVQYCFADGSVHPISNAIEQEIYLALSGINDQVYISSDDFRR